MLAISYKTAAGVAGKTFAKNPSIANAWLDRFGSPEGFELTITNDAGAVVGTKKIGDSQITWFERVAPPRKQKVSKHRQVLGCKSIMASLDQETIRKAKAIGNGNISLGLRIAVAAMAGFESGVGDEVRGEIREKLKKSAEAHSIFELQMLPGFTFDEYRDAINEEAGKIGTQVRVEEIRSCRDRLIVVPD